jgi:heme-degrading monooxygenase HmoA
MRRRCRYSGLRWRRHILLELRVLLQVKREVEHNVITRITRWQIAPDRIEDGIKVFKERVLPAAKKQKGYKSGYLLVDRKTGKFETVAFWNSEKDAIADEQSGEYQKRIDAGKERPIAAPVREIYEVIDL